MNEAYKVIWEPRALKHLQKLNNMALEEEIKNKVKNYLALDPRGLGERLEGKWKGSWKYRVRDYRIFYDIIDTEIKISVFRIKNRREAYDD